LTVILLTPISYAICLLAPFGHNQGHYLPLFPCGMEMTPLTPASPRERGEGDIRDFDAEV
jgi:hypothetical protein